MKNIILVVVLLFSMMSFSQESNINKSFRTKTSVVVYPYNLTTQKADTVMRFLLNDGIKFYVYKVLKTGYVISVWDFETDEKKDSFFDSLPAKDLNLLDNPSPGSDDYYRMSKNKVGLTVDTPAIQNSPFAKYNQLAYIDSWGNNMQFYIPLKEFNDNCESIFPRTLGFTWGFLTLPIKMRFGNSNKKFTFEEKINFGLSFGIKLQMPTTVYTAHNLLIGVSVANVKLTENESAAALSFSGGYMYQYDKFQIGAFVGFDFIGGDQSKQFDFQGKPWLGLAIGVSLFAENKMTAESSSSFNSNK